MKICILVMCCLALSCHRHTPVATKTGLVHRGTYAYQCVDSECAVGAVDNAALHKALDEIGCGSTYVCSVERRGDLFHVDIYSK